MSLSSLYIHPFSSIINFFQFLFGYLLDKLPILSSLPHPFVVCDSPTQFSSICYFYFFIPIVGTSFYDFLCLSLIRDHTHLLVTDYYLISSTSNYLFPFCTPPFPSTSIRQKRNLLLDLILPKPFHYIFLLVVIPSLRPSKISFSFTNIYTTLNRSQVCSKNF